MSTRVRPSLSISRPAKGDMGATPAAVAMFAEQNCHSGLSRDTLQTDEEFQLACKSARAAVLQFMAAVGAQILRDGAYR